MLNRVVAGIKSKIMTMQLLINKYRGWEITKAAQEGDEIRLLIEPPLTNPKDHLPIMLVFTDAQRLITSYELVSSQASIERETEDLNELASLNAAIDAVRTEQDGSLMVDCVSPGCFYIKLSIKAAQLSVVDLQGEPVHQEVAA